MIGVKKSIPTETKKVYLYKLNSDRIDEMSGELNRYGYARWLFKNDKLTTEVARDPGQIYRRSIWFEEPNFEKAKGLFIEYEQNLIKQARQKIETSKEMIEMIKQM